MNSEAGFAASATLQSAAQANPGKASRSCLRISIELGNKGKTMEAILQTIYDEDNQPSAYALYKIAQTAGHAFTRRWTNS
jgi:hypothetical protein